MSADSKLSSSDLERIAEIVREETGNQVREKNHSMLISRMTTHLLKLGLTSMAEYWAHFDKHEFDERETIKGLFTTHYTFFFREYAHFEVLQKWIDENLHLLKGRGAPLKVWCAAASRGQEAYSLAMYLEVNLSKKHGVAYEVIGTDIDAQSIAYAANGVYPIKEVSSIPQNYLQAFWKRGQGDTKEYAAILPALKSRVRFETLNLLEIQGWGNKDSFDIIFCRNVFIYFAEDVVRNIAMAARERLNSQGMFFSGVSEPLRFKEWDMESVGPSAYRRTQTKPKELEPVPIATATGPKYNVLCVDDSGTIQAIMRKIFSQDPACAGVKSAMNGREARELLNTHKFDVITLDIHMPEVNGIEFLERHYNRKTDPPVIMVSSVSRQDLDLATKSLSLGAFDYVEKPAMNTLQKSSAEILTKIKMALRAKVSEPTSAIGVFDQSIAQKIVVPDASQCLRVARASQNSVVGLANVVQAQAKESRSPALLVVFKEELMVGDVINKAMAWTDRPLIHLRELKGILRPNHIYIVADADAHNVLRSIGAKRVSLQLLDTSPIVWPEINSMPSLQLLVDEVQAGFAEGFARGLGVPLSDVTPSTSFASLSLEYFANFRKSAA